MGARAGGLIGLIGLMVAVPGVSGARVVELRGTAAERLVLEPSASRGVHMWIGEGVRLDVVERGALGPVTSRAGIASHARDGGHSFWMRGEQDGFEEWLSLEAGRAYGGRVAARWHVRGCSLREVPHTGGVHVLDADGRVLAYVDAPRAYAHGHDPVPARLSVVDGDLALFVDAGGRAVLVDPMWVATGTLHEQRNSFSQGHGLEAVPGGAIIVGGYGGSPRITTEIYDTATGVWRYAASMSVRRSGVSTTRLLDGRVLTSGGFNGSGSYYASAEVYDPTTDTWNAAGTMTHIRGAHTLTTLRDGRALVTGGYDTAPMLSCEIYDPTTNAWTATASMTDRRQQHTATLLNDGRVLVVGGYSGLASLPSVEIYDPTTDTFSIGAPLSVARYFHTATLLPSGEVLVVGGRSTPGMTPTAELYDPSAGTWSSAGSMVTGRYQHTATLLASGHVLITGGIAVTPTTVAELWDPTTRTFAATAADMPYARAGHTAIRLATGDVLIAGGGANISDLYTDGPCGNGRLDAGEGCDDGNTTAGDCCSPTCAFETAGTVCRASIAGCDPAETCSGSDGTCPVDVSSCAVDAFVDPDAWVAPDAAVGPDAYVAQDASIDPDAWVTPDAYVSRDAYVSPDAAIVGVDAATSPPTAGCACAVGTRSSGRDAAGWLAAVIGAWLATRRLAARSRRPTARAPRRLAAAGIRGGADASTANGVTLERIDLPARAP